MKHEIKKEEASLTTTPPLTHTNNLPNYNLPAKRVKLTPEGINQADIDAVNKRLTQMRKRAKGDILFIGGKFAKMRDKIPHGRWGRYIEQNFDLSIKTANIWIRAWENRDSELAVSDWGAYMRALYGNEQKKLKASNVSHDDEEDETYDQSGGKRLSGISRVPSVFADKGKPDLRNLIELKALLDKEFFQSKSYTAAAKLEFITELINWLENQKRNLRA